MTVRALHGKAHEALPKAGTWRDKNGDPAEVVTSQALYPLTATCAECGRPITALGVYQPFTHDGER